MFPSKTSIAMRMFVKKIQSFFVKISAPVLCYPLLNAWGKVEGVLKHRGKGGCT